MGRSSADVGTEVTPESRFDLSERPGHNEPGDQGDQPDNGQIVDRHTDALRDAPPGKPFDSRAHRGGEHEAEKDKRYDEPKLPNADGNDADPEDDERPDRSVAGGVGQFVAWRIVLSRAHNCSPFDSIAL